MPETVVQLGGHVISRTLPCSEWDRLRDFGPFKSAGVLPDPRHAAVVALETIGGKEIVGSWMARDIVMLEGLFLHEAYRHNLLAAKRLFFKMMHELKQAKVEQAITLIQDPYVAQLAAKAGFAQLPGSVHLLTLKGEV